MNTLREAVDGLYYMSETDSPFEVLLWQGQPAPLTTESLLKQVNESGNRPVEVRSVDTFFQRLVQEQDWHREEERAIAQRFRHLLELLNHHLTDIQVYRIGTIEIDIYVVGHSVTGNLIVLVTKAVET